MRISALIPAAAAALLLVGHANAQDKVNPAPKERAADSVKKIEEMQKERIATLKAAAEVSLKLAKGARIEIWEAVEDRMSLLKAELETADKDADRIALYTKAIDALKEYEALAKARFEAARGTELPLHKIKARRLDVEIQLERMKIKNSN